MNESSRTAALLAATALFVCGCATSPIGVRRMDPVSVQRELTANVLTEERASIETRNVLYRHGLFERFKKAPAAAIAALHDIAVTTHDDDAWFALAELSFLHGEKSGQRTYSITAAVYAWSYLFGGRPPDPFDPRLRLAADIYNRGLTQGLEQQSKKGFSIVSGRYELPIGELDVQFDRAVLNWNGRVLRDFVPVAELEVHGLQSRFRTPGIGAPLAASASATNVDAPSEEFLAPRLKTPVTALLRIEDVRGQIARGHIDATLELHTNVGDEYVTIAGRQVPLEKEPSASLAAMVAEAPVIRQEIEAFFGRLTQQSDAGKLAALRPHVRGRIPVVFVHGTGSSPARWAEMVNVLDNDPRISGRYEPWFFTYNSGSPIIYSSYLLRRSLKQAVAQLDPQGTDEYLHEMVVIGHSQGGLLTKMTAIDSGDRFWKNISKRPFEEAHLSEADKTLLHDVFFVEPLPFVSRVVFVCTPHRGSFLAAKDWVRRILTRLIRLPATVTTVTASMITQNPDLVVVDDVRSVNAVDNMAPSNRFVKMLVSVPVVPEVTANSIIAVQTPGEINLGNDGVVEYSSAHIEGVESEFVVHSNHSTQAIPETIEEVRRILLLHAARAEAVHAATADARKTARADLRQAGHPPSPNAAGLSPAPEARATSKPL
jgi:pimeloyl-ACP methyl ester carboxylesterase